MYCVKDITWGIRINGMTNALNTVKKRQHLLALKELGHAPDFEGKNAFMIYQDRAEFQCVDSTVIVDYEGFKKLFLELYHEYKEFPRYLIEMYAEEKEIDPSELNSYLTRGLKKGFISQKNNLFTLRK